MKDVDIWLTELWLEVADGEIEEADFKEEVKAKILESYHNGLDTKEYRGQALGNSSQEQSGKKHIRGEAKPRKLWPRRGREER